MAKIERTSSRVGSKASKQLRNAKNAKSQKSVAASALTQAPDRKRQKK